MGIASFATVVWSRHATYFLSNREERALCEKKVAKMTVVNVAPMQFIFVFKISYLNGLLS